MINATISLKGMEYFLLILVRIASFVYTAPIFSMNSVPQRIKLGMSFFLTIILYSVLPAQNIQYGTVIDYAFLIVKESIAGLLIGFSAFICYMILGFSGRLIDMEIGLAMAQQFDPTTKTQSSITGTMYSYLVLMLLLVSDMHIYLVNAIVESFSLIPIGGIKVSQRLYDIIVGFIADYFIIGFRIALPVFSAILIVNCVLGIMAKVAPQMNMFAVGVQIKLLAGLMIMFATVGMIPVIANFISSNMMRMVEDVMRGLM